MSKKLFSSQSDSEDESSSSFINVQESNFSEIPLTSQAPKISFGFSRQLKSKVVQISNSAHKDIASRVTEEETSHSEITHIENGLINGRAKPKKIEPVIPRVGQGNDWRIERLRKAVDDGTATDQQKAMLALLVEGLDELPTSSESTNSKLELKPEAKEEEPEDPDYDQISMTDFGAAFLRGRGWNKDEGIGRTNKRVVPLVIHAKGKTFDLGMEKKKKKTDDSEEAEIPLGPDVAVKILYGSEEGKYGRIVSVDLAAGHCEVKLPDGSIHEISERVLQTITDKEYAEKTRIITKNRKENKKTDKLSKQVERNLSISNDDDDEIKIVQDNSPPWAVPDLLVRIICKKYKEGRYYKDKMIVVDAPSRSHIELKDDKRRIHTLDQSQIETVIPRGIGGQIMIVRGRNKHRVGHIVNRNDKSYSLDVRLTGVKDVITVDFEDACDYRGNVEDMDYD